jgi:pyruvate ferredoxin oxidoreductase gamma subunit
MIRIRFHGRGGHGTKTASRIVGTAAFLSGYHAQDSPIYGAERRGAAVAAYTRIGTGPILERGVIERPDLIVLADETLLDAVDANVLEGQQSASAIFVNTQNADALVQKYNLATRVVAVDVTAVTLETLGSAGALSAGLAAVAARMIGIVPHEQLAAAMREEFSHLHLDSGVIDKSLRIAEKLFDVVQPVTFRATIGKGSALFLQQLPPEMVRVSYDRPVIATPSVFHTGNAVARLTGSWRVERPVIDREICTRCGLCFVRCPDGAIALDEEGFPVIDYDHCKGCLICHQICPLQAIEVEKETRAW